MIPGMDNCGLCDSKTSHAKAKRILEVVKARPIDPAKKWFRLNTNTMILTTEDKYNSLKTKM